MEDEEDRQPLLNEDGHLDSQFTAPRSRFLSAFRNRSLSKESFENNAPSNLFFNFAEEEEKTTEPDLIAAVFVVAFDTHSGKYRTIN